MITSFLLNLSAISLLSFIVIRNYDFAEIAHLEAYKDSRSIIVKDAYGEDIFKDGKGYEPVEIEEIPQDVVNALVATEDITFWSHIGINPFSLGSAAMKNITSRKVVRGGSTITQQLAKNLLYDLEPEIAKKKTKRKIREIILALRIEKKYSKSKIMEMYLNRVYFGRGAYGISAAAKAFFGKTLENLSLFECAYLIGLVQKPSLYAGNHKLALQRASHVLRRMEKVGYISKIDLSELDNLITLKPKNNFGADLFGEWIVKQIPKEIMELNKPIYIKTTFDSRSQKAFVQLIPEIEKNSRIKVDQLSFLVCDRTGGIRVMIGGKDTSIRGLNRCLQPRQAGSIFKVYIYLLAFLNGATPEQILDDTPISLGSWTPSNYKYQSVGSIFLKDAFAESVNSIAVQLVKENGLPKLINLARQIGITGHIESDMSISLGSACITLSQLSQTILIIMNNGYQVSPYGILEIRDSTDKLLWKKDLSLPEKLIEDDCAFWSMKETMLHTVESPRGTARAIKVANSKRAGKTGTSGSGNGPTDLWFACFDEKLTLCAWFGNDNGSFMEKGLGNKNPAVFAISEFISKERDKIVELSEKQIKSLSENSKTATLLDLPPVFQDPFSC